jgi:hypothetical protein
MQRDAPTLGVTQQHAALRGQRVDVVQDGFEINGDGGAGGPVATNVGGLHREALSHAGSQQAGPAAVCIGEAVSQ